MTAIVIGKKSGTVQYYGNDGTYHQYKFNDKEIEFINTTGVQPIDWGQRRYEVAKDMLVASLAQLISAVNPPSYAYICVQRTDVFIDELEKGSKCTEQKRYIISELQTDKMNYSAEFYLSSFYAGLICRAIQDNDLSLNTFRSGINEIRKAEKGDEDEYIPRRWEKV